MKPFLKWAGGKRWLASLYLPKTLDIRGRYVEPFVGSGAMFFAIEPKKAIISDLNKDLIETYIAIKENPIDVIHALNRHSIHHSESYYYHLRAYQPRTTTERAAKFIYLNRTCFNGLYRVNLKGEFNVPKGTKDSVLLKDDNFLLISKLLNKTSISHQDFEKTLNRCRANDFIYIDPPYTVKHNNNAFIKYNEHLFSWQDQIRLSSILNSMADTGMDIVISNANHPAVLDLYRKPYWVTIELPRFSSLASESSRRGNTSELLISSFSAYQKLGNIADNKINTRPRIIDSCLRNQTALG